MSALLDNVRSLFHNACFHEPVAADLTAWLQQARKGNRLWNHSPLPLGTVTPIRVQCGNASVYLDVASPGDF